VPQDARHGQRDKGRLKEKACRGRAKEIVTETRTLTPESRVQVPVGPPDKCKGYQFVAVPFLVCALLLTIQMTWLHKKMHKI
jgi:hypothetical protein